MQRRIQNFFSSWADFIFRRERNKKVVFIGSDLGPGVLDNFKKEITITEKKGVGNGKRK